jgi:bifunctional non-homologous end joining protein LigD
MAALLPMKATSFPSSGARPLPSGPGWVFELKFDGMRGIVEVHQGQARTWSSNGREATVTFPELAVLGPAFAHLDVVLDGEIVAFESGRPDFGRLQHRMHVTAPKEAARRATEVPVALVVFDVLQVGDRPTLALPWSDRRQLLESLADQFPTGVQLATVFADGPALLEAARRQGLEGIMAKRRDSLYAPGRRSPSWLKIKARRRQEFVVAGWQPGEGNRSGFLGSLLLGYHTHPRSPGGEPAPLRYAGKVGTGFSADELTRLRDLLAERVVPEPPFDPPPPRPVLRTARWCRPDLVAEVEFATWTQDDIVRHASYLGLRTDKDPADVVREP